MPSNDRKSQEHLIDRLRSLFGQPGPRKKKDGLPPKAHFSIWYFLMAILLFMYVQQYFFSSNVETISYSQFKQKVAEGSVSKLAIRPGKHLRNTEREGKQTGPAVHHGPGRRPRPRQGA